MSIFSHKISLKYYFEFFNSNIIYLLSTLKIFATAGDRVTCHFDRKIKPI